MATIPIDELLKLKRQRDNAIDEIASLRRQRDEARDELERVESILRSLTSSPELILALAQLDDIPVPEFEGRSVLIRQLAASIPVERVKEVLRMISAGLWVNSETIADQVAHQLGFILDDEAPNAQS